MSKVLFLALLPVVLLMAFVLYNDRKKPEPATKLFEAFFLGIISVFIVLIVVPVIEIFIDISSPTIMGSINKAFWGAAIPEEAAKLLILWLVLRKNSYFDEHFDGIVYAVMIGLGFAALENIMYLVSYYDNWVSVGIARAILSVPGHYAYAVFMGYFYSLAHFEHKMFYYVLAFAVPMLLHGLYDMLLMLTGVVPEGVIVLLMVMCIALCIFIHKGAFRRIKRLIEVDKIIAENKMCECDMVVTDEEGETQENL